MESMKRWLDVYREEIATLENTSDEEAIRKEVAEFEAELRKDYAEKKAKEIAHKRTVVANLEEVYARQEALEEEKRAIEEAKISEEVDTAIIEDVEKSTVVEIEELPVKDNPFDLNEL